MNIQMNFTRKAALFIWLIIQFLFIFNINCNCIFENKIYQVSDFILYLQKCVYVSLRLQSWFLIITGKWEAF
jgi:hypothetical protein